MRQAFCRRPKAVSAAIHAPRLAIVADPARALQASSMFW
jgi:hypothetical protein